MIVASAGQGGAARNGDGDYRCLIFYKERREMTHNPLGLNILVDESRFAIMRGFKSPEAEIFQMPHWFFVFVKKQTSFLQAKIAYESGYDNLWDVSCDFT